MTATVAPSVLLLSWAEEAHREGKRDRQGVIAREAVPAALKLRRIRSSREHRGDEAVEARDVEEEGVVGRAGEEINIPPDRG